MGRIKPRHLAPTVSVVPLLDTARPAAFPISDHPSAGAGRLYEPEVLPCPRRLWMLQNATPFPHSSQRSLEAPAVIAKPVLFRVRLERRAEPHAAPTLAWRMRHHWPRPGIVPGVPGFIPGVYVIQAEITAVSFNEQGGNHALRLSCFCASLWFHACWRVDASAMQSCRECR